MTHSIINPQSHIAEFLTGAPGPLLRDLCAAPGDTPQVLAEDTSYHSSKPWVGEPGDAWSCTPTQQVTEVMEAMSFPNVFEGSALGGLGAWVDVAPVRVREVSPVPDVIRGMTRIPLHYFTTKGFERILAGTFNCAVAEALDHHLLATLRNSSLLRQITLEDWNAEALASAVRRVEGELLCPTDRMMFGSEMIVGDFHHMGFCLGNRLHVRSSVIGNEAVLVHFALWGYPCIRPERFFLLK